VALFAALAQGLVGFLWVCGEGAVVGQPVRGSSRGFGGHLLVFAEIIGATWI
jgi:hypothetical protein